MHENPEEQLRLLIEEIRVRLEAGDMDALLAFVEPLHPSDMADVLEHVEEAERMALLELIPAALASDALAEMEEEEKPGELLASMEPERIAEIVEELADDDAADLIGELDPAEQARVFESVPDEEEQEIRELLEYPEESAGGIMTRELCAVDSEATAAAAIEELRAQAEETEDLYTVFVVGRRGRLRGVVTLRDLVLAAPETRISDLLEEPPAVVSVDLDQEEVGRILSRYNLAAIGVIDDEGRLVGQITFDDVIDVVEAEVTEDILRFAAVSDEEQLRGTTLGAIRSRLPWLAVNTLTLSVAAVAVWLYRDTIEQLAILAAVMPVIAGLGGNAGTQALAVTIRRIALADELPEERWSAVVKELVVGLVNGLAIGLLVALVSLLLPNTEAIFGLVVMIAMWGNLAVASALGAFFPILLERFGVDPAVASSVFVTTFTDLFGFVLLLGLATRFLL
ncbi:magnesium transporter [Candidatus Palauibacter soopunensis]|uniref:magnesium transporter n=1 Tax=Candidatus Palauibacter soopunensis TaxID=3056739 RepID=UPI0023879BA8|nr:magnesium transporter [Candidatus Palauibacter soopunensis]MDE2879250.1 magnesium transporter [Candidatus Palauibacter soopunensis]